MDPWDVIAAERRALADQVEVLTAPQWATPSLCAAWTVRDVVAHLVMAHKVSMPRFLVTLVGARGSFARANVSLTAREAARPTDDLVADLRRYADSRFAPPGMGPVAPLTDLFVHGQDIRIPLSLPDTGPSQAWTPILDFLVGARARRGFVDRALPAVRWVATDRDWTFGDGPEVRAPAVALALTMMGRPARAEALSGPGASTAAAWLGSRP